MASRARGHRRVCGIGGIFAPSLGAEALDAAAARLVAALHHRGPDARGRVLVGGVDRAGVLVATRLAIQDPSSLGDQPMRDPVTGSWVVLNGEIYNHLDLRRELDDPAEGWRSRSDTETVLRAFRRWGAACVDRLRGMFAIAVWDEAQRTLWLARDPLGIKPLYLATVPGGLVFASEVRALLATGAVEARLDERGLAGFMRFGAVPDPLTLLEGVTSLPAGHTLRLTPAGLEPPRCYWRPPRPRPAARAEVSSEVARAVREHLLSDVPVACLLSGGIDSSVVMALAARGGQRVTAFTFGFDDRQLDESNEAAETARHLGVDHRVLRLDRDEVARLLPAALRDQDLPTADGINTWVIARAVAREGYKVVLSGLGGDELFGGYTSFRLLPRLHRWRGLVGRLPRRVLRAVAGGGGRGGRLVAMAARAATLRGRYEQLRSFWADDELVGMGLDPAAPLTDEEPGPEVDAEVAVSRLELTGYMRSTLLRDSDVMSMAHSLELRVPLLDHRLVMTCLEAGVAGERPPKAALLAAADGLLPPSVDRRRKRGFVLPMDAWLRGPLVELVEDGLAVVERRLPRIPVRDLRARFLGRRLPWARLWEVVVLGHWLRARALA